METRRVFCPSSASSGPTNAFVINKFLHHRLSHGRAAYITTISFRADCLATGSRALVSTTNLHVWFSTTSKGPDELSAKFAENDGPDRMEARNREENFGMMNQGCLDPGGTFPVGPRIDMDVPFAYDPAKGNLLMEVHMQARDVPTGPFFLDGENAVNDAISRVVARGFEAEIANIVHDTVGVPVYFVFYGSPTLSVELTSQGITLGWASNPVGFRLQWTSVVGSEAVWADYPGTTPDNPTLKLVNVSREELGQTRYFRLIHPTLPPLGN